MAWWDDISFFGDSSADYSQDAAPTGWSDAPVDDSVYGSYGGSTPYDYDVFGGTGSQFISTPSDSDMGSQYMREYRDTPSPSEMWIDSGGLGSGSYQTYADNNAVQPGLWDTINSYGRAIESPGGKMMVGGLGALVSAYGAGKQNKLNKKASKQQQAMLAARMARNQAHDAPLNFAQARQRVAPVATRGESSWYDQNALSANKPTSDKGIFAAAEGGQPPVDEDKPSIGGFLSYMAHGRKLPSERRTAEEDKLHRARWDAGARVRRQEADALGEPEPQYVPIMRAQGGLTAYVQGGTSGQADKIPAQLSAGEYIMDADTVASLGDGNNAAGAAKLDKMRQNIRVHKRAAPTSKIPPKAKAPQAYLKGK